MLEAPFSISENAMISVARSGEPSPLEGAVPVRVEGATAVGLRWREMGIPYVVMHGLEGYPDRIGRDLDILMDQSVAEAALGEAATVLARLGWRSVRPPDIWGKRLVALRSKGRGEFGYLELHTLGSLRWVVVPLVENTEVATHTVGPFPASRWATFVKGLVSPALAGDLARYTPEYIDRHVRSGIRPETIDFRCREYFGSDLGDALIQGLENRDPSRFTETAAPLRRLLVGKMVKRPMVSLRETPAFLRKRLMKPFSPSGLHVLLRAPKSPQVGLVVDSLVYKLSDFFSEIDVRDSNSSRRTMSERLRLYAGQGLAMDLTDNVSANGRLSASIDKWGSPSASIDFALEENSASDISGYLAEWVLGAWIENLLSRRTP